MNKKDDIANPNARPIIDDKACMSHLRRIPTIEHSHFPEQL